jgi:3-deoxy-D-manno-octulosonic-acid transferase
MELLYLIGVTGYGFLILLASLFNQKARLWIRGRKNWKSEINSRLVTGEKRILFHCSSLGEFEQGKPVLEALRTHYPKHKFVLTFFSPSGYENRKNDPLADYVFYLPLDGPVNARSFISLVKPEIAFFVKYDFWHYFIRELRKNKIPVYFVSSIFRPSQIFFKPYGFFFRNILNRVSHFFVQNQQSLELLYQYSLPQVTVTGDTRFDRVYKNSLDAKEFPDVLQFKGKQRMLVAGSTWAPDEILLAQVCHSLKDEFRFIIVPHETGESNIRATEKRFAAIGTIRYSQYNPAASAPGIMIIDNVGMLSSLYRYADIAFVGGGFGRGIHNILEAAVFGIPVFFGPNYQKFREAHELIHWKGAFPVKDHKALENHIRGILDHPGTLDRIREVNLKYIENNKGATELIIEYLHMHELK